MRTTLILDGDVAAKLSAEARRSGRSFRDVVNDTLRRGLSIQRGAPAQNPFTVAAQDLGTLWPGLSLDNLADLLEQVEGPLHR